MKRYFRSAFPVPLICGDAHCCSGRLDSNLNSGITAAQFAQKHPPRYSIKELESRFAVLQLLRGLELQLESFPAISGRNAADNTPQICYIRALLLLVATV